MLRNASLLAMAVLLGGGVACKSGRHSSVGFRLPPDGDAERGKAAFVKYGCQTCHEVSGVDLPRPTVQPPVPVVLGGEIASEYSASDGYLVTSIIHPSYTLAHYPKDQIARNGKSRMPQYADDLTVRELTDIVAFLQSRYVVRPLPAKYAYR